IPIQIATYNDNLDITFMKPVFIQIICYIDPTLVRVIILNFEMSFQPNIGCVVLFPDVSQILIKIFYPHADFLINGIVVIPKFSFHSPLLFPLFTTIIIYAINYTSDSSIVSGFAYYLIYAIGTGLDLIRSCKFGQSHRIGFIIGKMIYSITNGKVSF